MYGSFSFVALPGSDPFILRPVGPRPGHAGVVRGDHIIKTLLSALGYIRLYMAICMAYIWLIYGYMWPIYGLYMAYIWRKCDFSDYFSPKNVENVIFPFIFHQKASKMWFFRLFFPKKRRKCDFSVYFPQKASKM